MFTFNFNPKYIRHTYMNPIYIWVCALKGVPFRGCLDWGMLREYVSGYVSGFDSGYASRYASESFIRPEYNRLNSNYREERREGRGTGV